MPAHPCNQLTPTSEMQVGHQTTFSLSGNAPVHASIIPAEAVRRRPAAAAAAPAGAAGQRGGPHGCAISRRSAGGGPRPRRPPRRTAAPADRMSPPLLIAHCSYFSHVFMV